MRTMLTTPQMITANPVHFRYASKHTLLLGRVVVNYYFFLFGALIINDQLTFVLRILLHNVVILTARLALCRSHSRAFELRGQHPIARNATPSSVCVTTHFAPHGQHPIVRHAALSVDREYVHHPLYISEECMMWPPLIMQMEEPSNIDGNSANDLS
jgi:hypothetical protein